MATRHTTVDEAESARFAALAAEWWDEDGAMAPLHRMNPARMRFLRDRLCAHFGREADRPRPLAGLRVLDVGCGGGLVCEPLTRLGATVTGIDATAEMVGAARAHAAAMRLAIDYRVAAVEEMTEAFDAVIALEVIEHVADRELFLDSLCARVAPGGALVLSTLNRTAKAFALGIVGAEYVMRLLPRGTHSWGRFVKPSELARALRRHGFRLTELSGLVYDLAAGEWRLHPRDLDVNYLAMAIKA